MKLKYGLDEVPPRRDTMLFGLQWLAISIPGIVILGKIVGSLHFPDATDQIVYLQKIYFVTGIMLFCQIMWGHRLPLIAGPSTVLLIGVIASAGAGLNAIYGSLAIGGILLFLVSATGLFGHIQRLFTPRVVASLLLLIALTLAPTVIKLLTTTGPGESVPANLSFAMAVALLMLLLYRRLKGMWKSTLIIWSMAGASIAHFFLFSGSGEPRGAASLALVSPFFHRLTTGLSFEPGVLISFLFCFFALAVNDISSIQSISGLLKPSEPRKRLNRGLIITGLANILSGFLGVIGTVNFSLSPGVIMASGCASRFVLIPTAAGLMALSFSPLAAGVISAIPPVVIGAMLIYVLCYQIAAGLMVAAGPGAGFTLESGLTIGLPLFLGTVFSFLPEHVVHAFPLLLRPLIGNGFVVGVLASLVLEHIVFTKDSGAD
jgi:xanthine/uracil permease